MPTGLEGAKTPQQQHARGLKNCSGSRRASTRLKRHAGMLAQATIIDEQELAPLQAALMTARVLNVKRGRRRLTFLCGLCRMLLRSRIIIVLNNTLCSTTRRASRVAPFWSTSRGGIIAQNHCTILMHFFAKPAASPAGALAVLRAQIYVTDFTASHHKVLLLLCTTKWCLRASGWDGSPLAIRSAPMDISPIYGHAQKDARVLSLLALLATCAE